MARHDGRRAGVARAGGGCERVKPSTGDHLFVFWLGKGLRNVLLGSAVGEIGANVAFGVTVVPWYLTP